MVILYNPPSSASRKPILPMSLLALGALLEGEHEYRIIDGNLLADGVNGLERLIRETGADVLGVTVMPGPQLRDAVPTCREIKRRFPQLTIVWGGYFPTQHYDVCLRTDFVDYVVCGHGELIFKSLLDILANQGDPTGLQGLAWRDGATGEVRCGSPGPIPHPDHLPDFPYRRVEMERYVRRTFMGNRTLSHHSSYGCPFSCNFCAVVNMVNGRWLAQSAEHAAEVVKLLARDYGVDSVEFHDNNFFTDEARSAEFSERIMDQRIGWWGEARIDTLLKYSAKSWRLLRDSGLKMVFLGAESGADETLRRMNKGGTASADKTLAIAAVMKEYDIVPEMSFVLGNPPDPEADMRLTMEFIRKVKRVNPQTEIILYLYTPVPLAGTLYDQARSAGFRFPTDIEEWISPEWQEFSQRRSTHLPWLQDPVRRTVRDFQWVINAYYPTATDIGMSAVKRFLLRALGSWRYHLRIYRHPLELRAFHKLLSYQRPETDGF